MSGIELQLLCGVRIELALGSLPYPVMIRIPGCVLYETGNYRTRATNGRGFKSKIIILGSGLPHKKRIKNSF